MHPRMEIDLPLWFPVAQYGGLNSYKFTITLIHVLLN